MEYWMVIEIDEDHVNVGWRLRTVLEMEDQNLRPCVIG